MCGIAARPFGAAPFSLRGGAGTARAGVWCWDAKNKMARPAEMRSTGHRPVSRMDQT
jgi:hypothetical protein